jgi:hypothetical protein
LRVNNISSAKCLDCGEVLAQPDLKCPKCGSTKRVYSRVIIDSFVVSDENLNLKQRSGLKDTRGKCVNETNIKIRKNVQTVITIDRSKRLNGIPETDVYHKVIKNGKTIHGPHLEPKAKNRNKGSEPVK